jgi:RNA polymerase sigma factor (sigma-70 family)
VVAGSIHIHLQPQVRLPCLFTMDSDRMLVEAVLANAAGAFERLVREHQRLCWHIIFRIVHQREDAEDLCQETFLRVHRYLPQYRFESALKTWIGRIAYSVALRYMERRRLPTMECNTEGSPTDIIEDALDIEAASISAQLVSLMLDAVEALPPLERTLITLYHVEELSIGSMSEITQLPSGTVKSHLFRARAKLRAKLTTTLGETP